MKRLSKMSKSLLFCFTLVFGLCSLSYGQQTTEQKKEKLAALRLVIQSVAAIDKDIQTKSVEYDTLQTTEQKANVAEEIEALDQRKGELEKEFAVLATGLDENTFFQRGGEDFIWQNELRDIFSPLVTELKELTSTPREIEKLRGNVEYFKNRLPEIKTAITQAEELQAAARRRSVKRRLTEKVKFWKQQEILFFKLILSQRQMIKKRWSFWKNLKRKTWMIIKK